MQMKKPFLNNILFFSLILALYNAIAMKLHLFWVTTWLDSPSHVIGGFLSALIASTFLSIINFKNIRPNSPFFLFLMTLIIGILWEIFEAKANLTFPDEAGYWLDTISDIVCDLAGGVFAYYYLIKSYYARV